MSAETESLNSKIGRVVVEQVDEYVASALANIDKPMCKKVQWAFNRYLQDKENPLWYLDYDEIGKCIKWSSLFTHSKGVLAGKPIQLELFQKFIVVNIYGFKRKDDGYMRFNKMYVQLARKNAKSQLLALLSSYELFRNQEMAEVYVAGVNKEQSDIVFNEVLYQLNTCKFLEGRYTYGYGKITRHRTMGVIAPLSKETKKTGDGKNPSLIIIDEYHAHQTSAILDVLDSGTGARAEPLTAIITTAGFDYNAPCYTIEYKFISRMAKGEALNDDYFALVFELDEGDDPFDESVWHKSNPINVTYAAGVRGLRKFANAAKDVDENLRNYLTKNMNVWVDMKENGYMNMAYLKEQVIDDTHEIMSDLDNKAIIGLDLSSDTDLTAVSWVRRRISKPDEYVVFSHAFMPSAKYHERLHLDHIPYDIYVRQGHLTLTEGRTVDYDQVGEFIEKLIARHNVLQICYDKWNAMHFMGQLQKKGYTVIEVPQTIAHLSSPTKTLRKDVYDKKAYIQDNGLLVTCFSNAITLSDTNDNIKINKDKSIGRIDMAAATINAIAHLHDLPITPRVRTF